MRVVFPAPLGPNTASLSPFDKLRFIFSRALNPSGYSKLKLSTLRYCLVHKTNLSTIQITIENTEIIRIKLDELNSRASSSNVPLKPLEIIEL